MKTSSKPILPLALATALALAPAAAAQEAEGEVVPPENSAATQYTEAFPTAGGNRDAHEHRGREASPRAALGARNARRLAREGRAGRAVAELTVDTAPAPAEPVVGDDEDTSGAAGSGSGKHGPGGGQRNPAGASQPKPQSAPRSGNARPAVDAAAASGSSGAGAVLARAVGASPSNGAGFLLTLLVLATIAWAIAYASRQRQTAR